MNPSPPTVLSDRGCKFIAEFEGFRAQPYNDPTNNATVGFGHLIHLGPVTQKDRIEWGTVTRAEALTLLKHDAMKATVTILHLVRPAIQRQYRLDALISLVFNIGTGAFAGSTLLQKINSGIKREGVEKEWIKWCHGNNGEVIPGLLDRRKKELHLWETGSYA